MFITCYCVTLFCLHVKYFVHSIGLRNITMTVCVCMSMYMYACLFVREDISETRCSNFIEFSVHLRVAVARFSSDGIVLLCFFCVFSVRITIYVHILRYTSGFLDKSRLHTVAKHSDEQSTYTQSDSPGAASGTKSAVYDYLVA